MGVNSSKTKLVLIELIIIILFFSIASGVCVNIFAQAKFMSVKSTEITNSVLLIQSAAETIRSAEDEEVVLNSNYQKQGNSSRYISYYDNTWSESTNPDAKYNMVIDLSREGDVLVAQIAVNKSEDEIYSVTTKKYTGK